MLKQNPKTTDREKWQKGKSHKRSTLEEKKTESLDCATQLGKNMLDNKDLKQLPKRMKIACQNEIQQVMLKYMKAVKNIENSLINQVSQKPLHSL